MLVLVAVKEAGGSLSNLDGYLQHDIRHAYVILEGRSQERMVRGIPNPNPKKSSFAAVNNGCFAFGSLTRTADKK